ncbi:hypothetical protein LRQ04_16930 [Paenarthrobacter sp. AR 02]|uniref:hypothetical protein n=1 Tax=Paenarthrobacter sp. AR 02 TaxID=2899821 RepID=UPI001F2884D9|nr:hypothetical protein [Paenarthrobacter sp. AR 02]MCF3140939.1 hypothetical protein [Paenarthrobacter sp. AR 02]
MNQSTESTTEANPFTKPGFIIAAALVVALIAAAIVIFLVPKGQENAQPVAADSSSAAAASPSAHAAAGKSVCGLPAGKETALGAAPKSKWELVGKMAAPTDPRTFGPGLTDDTGFRSCFAQSPTGALYSAVNLVALGSSKSQQMNIKLADKLMAPGAGREAAKQQAMTLDPSTGSNDTVQVRGFLLKSYTPNEANIDLAFQTSGGKLFHAVLPLQWLDGDWKVKVSDAGQLINDVAQLSDVSGYIAWAGV